MRKRLCELLYVVLAIALYIFIVDLLGIGCPIKFVTGVSCAGCGMSRAWICAIHFDFYQAVQYHPLFATVPFFAVFMVVRDKIPPKWFHRIIGFYCTIFIAVYLFRLLNPQDTVVEINFKQSVMWRLYEQMRRILG